MALEIGQIAGMALRRVRQTAARALPVAVAGGSSEGEEAGSRKQEAGDREEAMAEQDERVDEEVTAAAVAEEEGEEEDDGQEQERAPAAARPRVRAAVLDVGRPAAPAAWRELPALDLIAQGIAETDRKRRR